MKIVKLVVVALLTACTAASAESSTYEEMRKKFELFTNCKRLDILIERLPKDAIEIGLNRDRLRTAVESRLRSARLFDAESYEHLYVNVNVVGRAFNVEIELQKDLYDPLSGITLTAKTWGKGFTGTHGQSPEYIRSAVAELIDIFLLEYLKVNEEACTG